MPSLCRCVVFAGGLLTVVVTLPLRADEPEAKKPAQQVRLDTHGEPLPPGAIARIGDVRFRHGSMCSLVAFQDDGKTILSVGNDGAVRYWDTKTGHLVRTFRFGRWCHPAALTNDGKLLAVATPDFQCRDLGSREGEKGTCAAGA